MQATGVIRGLAVLGLLTAVSARAWGTAVYATVVSSSFIFGDPGAITSVTDHAPTTTLVPTFGDATASIVTFVASADGVKTATVDSAVAGSANAPPTSLSNAAAQRGHVYVVPRVSGTDPLPEIIVPFTFTISWSVHLAIDHPDLEFASGGAFFGISGFEEGIDSITLDAGMPGEVAVVDGKLGWRFNPRYELVGPGPGPMTLDEPHSTIVTGTIKVFSGMVGEFSVITDTAGRAGARVPEPASWSLVLLPLLACSAWRRRRG